MVKITGCMLKTNNVREKKVSFSVNPKQIL